MGRSRQRFCIKQNAFSIKTSTEFGSNIEEWNFYGTINEGNLAQKIIPTSSIISTCKINTLTFANGILKNLEPYVRQGEDPRRVQHFLKPETSFLLMLKRVYLIWKLSYPLLYKKRA